MECHAPLDKKRCVKKGASPPPLAHQQPLPARSVGRSMLQPQSVHVWKRIPAWALFLMVSLDDFAKGGLPLSRASSASAATDTPRLASVSISHRPMWLWSPVWDGGGRRTRAPAGQRPGCGPRRRGYALAVADTRRCRGLRAPAVQTGAFAPESFTQPRPSQRFTYHRQTVAPLKAAVSAALSQGCAMTARGPSGR